MGIPHHPDSLQLFPFLVVGFFVNLYFVHKVDERNIVNDLTAILLSALVGSAATRLIEFFFTQLLLLLLVLNVEGGI